MKILVQNPIDPILEGIAQSISLIGETLIVWDNKNIPFNDIYDIHKPDLVVVYGDALKEKPSCPSVTIGDFNIWQPDLTCVSSLNTPYKENSLIIKPAANVAYHNIKSDPDYASSVFYYSQNTLPEHLEYLQKVGELFQLKIIGQHYIPLPSYLGIGNVDSIVKFMKSCQIALSFDIHTTYTYAANKVFCLTNQPQDVFPLVFNSVDDLVGLIETCLEPQGSAQIQQDIDNAYTQVINNDTYLHRTHNIFTRLDFNEQAEKCLKVLQQIQASN